MGVTILVSETDEALVKKGEIVITAVLLHAIKIHPRGRFLQARDSSARRLMPLSVLAGPGCDAAGKDQYVARVANAGDVVISVGKIYAALGGQGVPSTNSGDVAPCALHAGGGDPAGARSRS